MNAQTPATSFNGLGIAPKILETLERLKFTQPTPIQASAIPAALTGKDLMGIAQTGTGKTLAFGIPLLQRLAAHKGMGLILLPTRELALQVDESLHTVGKAFGLKSAVLIGGEAMGRQLQALRRQPHVIVATPGRLIDHLEHGSVRLDSVKILILDEADRMLDMGFAPQLKKIVERVPKERQTMLFSATMPDEIVRMASTYMHLPVRVEVAPAGTASQLVTQELFFVHKADKPALLEKLLSEYRGSVLVFTRTKFGAKKVARSVRNFGHTANELHSNRSLSQRKDALEGFKRGVYRVLVATDIAARGIDVTAIELVINFDLPDQAEDYVHRIGRTGRAALTGHAISFATPEERGDVKAIERLIRKSLPISKTPELPKRMLADIPRDEQRQGRSFSRPQRKAPAAQTSSSAAKPWRFASPIQQRRSRPPRFKQSARSRY